MKMDFNKKSTETHKKGAWCSDSVDDHISVAAAAICRLIDLPVCRMGKTLCVRLCPRGSSHDTTG
jgi:hypothetical protein